MTDNHGGIFRSPRCPDCKPEWSMADPGPCERCHQPWTRMIDLHQPRRRADSIRQFVRRRLTDGAPPDERLWHETEAHFPNRSISWNYVSGIIREWRRETPPGAPQ